MLLRYIMAFRYYKWDVQHLNETDVLYWMFSEIKGVNGIYRLFKKTEKNRL